MNCGTSRAGPDALEDDEASGLEPRLDALGLVVDGPPEERDPLVEHGILDGREHAAQRRDALEEEIDGEFIAVRWRVQICSA